LSIVLPYFEMIGKCMEGVTRPGASFRTGFRKVFQHIDAPDMTLSKLYDILRNALYHFGTVRSSNLYITRDMTEPITYNDFLFTINPDSFIATIRNHFEWYISELEKEINTTLREKFEQEFDNQVRAIPNSQPSTWSTFSDFPIPTIHHTDDKNIPPSSTGGTVSH
jgi:hypothetical protein